MGYFGKTMISIFVLASILACDSNNSDELGNENGDLHGTLLYNSGEGIYAFDLASNNKRVYFDHNNYSLNGWDVSWDGQTRLETSTIGGDFDHVLFKWVNTSNGSVEKEIRYNLVGGQDRAISALLSPDKSLLLIQPDFDHGIIVLNDQGEVIRHLPDVNGKSLTLGDEALWLPGNTILFTFDKKYIFKTEPPYESPVPVKEMDYSSWGNLHASRDGSKISLCIDKHIYTMDIDGNNLVQVTESDKQEREGVFSPDGNHLLIAANYIPGTFHVGTWDLNIIPLDGKTHRVGNDVSTSVNVIRGSNDAPIEGGSGNMLWR